MNKLISIVGIGAYGLKYGVLETPMFPAKYYGGPFDTFGNVYTPKNNETHLWHRTVNDAEKAAFNIFETCQYNDKALK